MQGAFIDPFHAVLNHELGRSLPSHGSGFARGDVKRAPVAQHAPGNPCQFVGQGRGELITVKPFGALFQPSPEAEALPVVRAHQDHVRGLDEQGAQVAAAGLGDPP